MKNYTVEARSVRLTSGVLKLSEDQVRRRSHKLKQVDGGHEIVDSVEFKQGETFGYDGNVPKGLMKQLTEKKSKK
jgi:hypothetical protein